AKRRTSRRALAAVARGRRAFCLRHECGRRKVPPNHAKVPGLHFDLLTVHPFEDGNGRTARLLQNLHLIREGFASTLIGPDEKAAYFDVLLKAQIAVPGIGNAAPFIDYIAALEKRSLERYLESIRLSTD